MKREINLTEWMDEAGYSIKHLAWDPKQGVFHKRYRPLDNSGDKCTPEQTM